MKKLNPAKIARIQARKAQGATFEDLKNEFKCSVGTINNALKFSLKKAKPSKPAPDRTPAAPTDGERPPPTPEDLRRDLASQIRGLQGELEASESPALRASLNRVLVSARQLLARVTPPDPNVAPPGMCVVPAHEMNALAERGEAMLERLIKGAIDEAMSWPACHACGHPVAPPDIDQRLAEMSDVQRLYVGLLMMSKP